MVPGGATERVKKDGGEELYISLQMALAGHSVPQVIYALTRSTSSAVLFAADTEEAAVELIERMATDAINELRLNWADKDQLIANSVASWHGEGGRG